MDTIEWTGKSGTDYRFEVYPLGTEFVPLPGVYIFCVLTGGVYKALYVGETDSLYDRLNARLDDHDGFERARAYGVSHVGAMLVDNPTQRLRIEIDLRHGMNPVCNREAIPASR